MASPRVLDYDDLHSYLESIAETYQDLADDYDESGKDVEAVRYWAKAEAIREVQQHIELELEWNRG